MKELTGDFAAWQHPHVVNATQEKWEILQHVAYFRDMSPIVSLVSLHVTVWSAVSVLKEFIDPKT